MKKIGQVQWTASTLEEARRIATELVEKKLVACANIFPHIESIYIWNGKLEKGHEIKVILKTRVELFLEVKNFIEAHCSYEVPAISLIQFEDGNEAFFNWISSSTTNSECIHSEKGL